MSADITTGDPTETFDQTKQEMISQPHEDEPATSNLVSTLNIPSLLEGNRHTEESKSSDKSTTDETPFISPRLTMWHYDDAIAITRFSRPITPTFLDDIINNTDLNIAAIVDSDNNKEQLASLEEKYSDDNNEESNSLKPIEFDKDFNSDCARDVSISWQTQVAHAQLYGEGEDNEDDEEISLFEDEVISEAELKEKIISTNILEKSHEISNSTAENDGLSGDGTSIAADSAEVDVTYQLSSLSLAPCSSSSESEGSSGFDEKDADIRSTSSADPTEGWPKNSFEETKAFSVEIAINPLDISDDNFQYQEEDREKEQEKEFAQTSKKNNFSSTFQLIPEKIKSNDPVLQVPRQRKHWDIRPDSALNKSQQQFSLSAPVLIMDNYSGFQKIQPTQSPHLDPLTFPFNFNRKLSTFSLADSISPNQDTKAYTISSTSSLSFLSSSTNFGLTHTMFDKVQTEPSPSSPSSPLLPIPQRPINTIDITNYITTNRNIYRARRKLTKQMKERITHQNLKCPQDDQIECDFICDEERKELSWDEVRILREKSKKKTSSKAERNNKISKLKSQHKNNNIELINNGQNAHHEYESLSKCMCENLNKNRDFDLQQKRAEAKNHTRFTNNVNSDRQLPPIHHQSTKFNLGKRSIGADEHCRDGESVTKRSRKKYRYDKLLIWMTRRDEEKELNQILEAMKQKNIEEKILKEVERRETVAALNNPRSFIDSTTKTRASHQFQRLLSSPIARSHHTYRHLNSKSRKVTKEFGYSYLPLKFTTSVKSNSKKAGLTESFSFSRSRQQDQKFEGTRQLAEFSVGVGVILPPLINPFELNSYLPSQYHPYLFTSNRAKIDQTNKNVFSAISPSSLKPFDNPFKFEASSTKKNQIKSSPLHNPTVHVVNTSLKFKKEKEKTSNPTVSKFTSDFEESKEIFQLPSTSTFIPHTSNLSSNRQKLIRPKTANSPLHNNLLINSQFLSPTTTSRTSNDPYIASPTSPGKKMKASLIERRGRKRHEEEEKSIPVQRKMVFTSPHRNNKYGQSGGYFFNSTNQPLMKIDTATFNQPRKTMLSPLYTRPSSAYADAKSRSTINVPLSNHTPIYNKESRYPTHHIASLGENRYLHSDHYRNDEFTVS